MTAMGWCKTTAAPPYRRRLAVVAPAAVQSTVIIMVGPLGKNEMNAHRHAGAPPA
jgi:hypothetical protein